MNIRFRSSLAFICLSGSFLLTASFAQTTGSSGMHSVADTGFSDFSTGYQEGGVPDTLYRCPSSLIVPPMLKKSREATIALSQALSGGNFRLVGSGRIDMITDSGARVIFDSVGTKKIFWEAEGCPLLSQQIDVFEGIVLVLSDENVDDLRSLSRDGETSVLGILPLTPSTISGWTETPIGQSILDVDSMVVYTKQSSSFVDMVKIIENFRLSQGLTGKMAPVIYVPSYNLTIEKALLGSFFARYFSSVYTMTKEEMIEFWYNISLGKGAVSGVPQKAILINDTNNSFLNILSLRALIDTMIWYGIDSILIGIMYTTMMALVCMMLRKHVGGLYGYGFFYPVMFALTIGIFGRVVAMMLFALAWLADTIHKLLLSRISLLLYARWGLYFMMYTILGLIGLGILSQWTRTSGFFSITDPLTILLGLFLIAFCAKKIFGKRIQGLAKSDYIHIGVFCLLSGGLSLIIFSSAIHGFVLVYPSVLWLLVCLVFLLGRYTGLTVREYFRFRSLIMFSSTPKAHQEKPSDKS